MKTRRYLKQFRANLEAGSECTLITDTGIKTVQIVSIFRTTFGSRFTYFDEHGSQHQDNLKNVLPRLK